MTLAIPNIKKTLGSPYAIDKILRSLKKALICTKEGDVITREPKHTKKQQKQLVGAVAVHRLLFFDTQFRADPQMAGSVNACTRVILITHYARVGLSVTTLNAH